MPTQRISVRVPARIVKGLKERSRATGARESDVVREALEKHLSRDAARPTTAPWKPGSSAWFAVRRRI
jgi:Arc/MetJ-type ribon-helix-helix transcriptional regulator